LFLIERSGGTGDFDRGLGTTLTADSSPSPYSLEYDKLNNTVLIKFNGDVVADVYRLTVKSSLTDVYGSPLEGVAGQPGSDFRIILGQQASMGEALDPRGIVNTTGQYVPYQEFTKPWNQANGFNPSDKVVTRVARLYYYRDAHRVAQIINRKVKSYNRTGARFGPATRRPALARSPNKRRPSASKPNGTRLRRPGRLGRRKPNCDMPRIR
jgi:hypothetical protein